ncbi:hypothetical protein BH23CHL8_BH23CHL8_17730 [soil metagenome]
MCLNCGCGEPETRHQPSDIVREDVERAAQGQQMSIEETASNMRASLETLQADAADTHGRSSV